MADRTGTNLRLDDETRAALRLIKEADGLPSQQAAIVVAIHEAAARRGHERAVRDAADRQVRRWEDTLRRLGEGPR